MRKIGLAVFALLLGGMLFIPVKDVAAAEVESPTTSPTRGQVANCLVAGW